MRQQYRREYDYFYHREGSAGKCERVAAGFKTQAERKVLLTDNETLYDFSFKQPIQTQFDALNVTAMLTTSQFTEDKGFDGTK